MCRLSIPPAAFAQRVHGPKPTFFPAFAWHNALDLSSSRLFSKRGSMVLACLHGTVAVGVVLTSVLEWASSAAVSAPYAAFSAKFTNWCVFSPVDD